MAQRLRCGKYVGRAVCRPGREDELSPQERKQMKASTPIELELREDGTFVKQITVGTYEVDGERVIFRPLRFGGQTLDEMQRVAEEMGRYFGLAFVFNNFELLIEGEVLVTPDPTALIYTVYSLD
jgi:hypothetical protein